MKSGRAVLERLREVVSVVKRSKLGLRIVVAFALGASVLAEFVGKNVRQQELVDRQLG